MVLNKKLLVLFASVLLFAVASSEPVPPEEESLIDLTEPDASLYDLYRDYAESRLELIEVARDLNESIITLMGHESYEGVVGEDELAEIRLVVRALDVLSPMLEEVE